MKRGAIMAPPGAASPQIGVIELSYNWRHDIDDLTDDGEIEALGWDREAVDTAFYVAAETIAADEGVGVSYMPRYMDLDMGARERHVIEHLRDVKCLQGADGGKAVVKFVGDDGSGFDAAYDPRESRWALC